MNNEKYLNYYIETMTATLTDCVVRNVSLQANAKVTEEVINEQSKLIEELRLSSEQKNNSDVQLIDELRNENGKLNNTINQLNIFKKQYDDVKNQVNHIETFRNELIKSRKETEDVRSEMSKVIDELNSKIDYLQLTPAKRKKIDSLNKPEETNTIIEVFSEPFSKAEDGGTF